MRSLVTSNRQGPRRTPVPTAVPRPGLPSQRLGLPSVCLELPRSRPCSANKAARESAEGASQQPFLHVMIPPGAHRKVRNHAVWANHEFVAIAAAAAPDGGSLASWPGSKEACQSALRSKPSTAPVRQAAPAAALQKHRHLPTKPYMCWDSLGRGRRSSAAPSRKERPLPSSPTLKPRTELGPPMGNRS